MGCFKGFLCYAGTEVVNHAQTAAYIASMGHPGLAAPLDASCVCDGLDNADAGGAPIPWATPSSDDAWWYDVANPASGDVVGVWLDDMTISAPFKRDRKDRLWGASLASPAYAGREVVLTGWCLTRSDAATHYMQNALHEAFSASGSANCSECTAPDLTYWTHCPVDGDETGHIRKLRQVGMVSFNKSLEPDFPCCWGFKFQVTLGVEVPWIEKVAATVYDGPVIVNEAICNICNPCPAITAVDITCGCLTQPIRVVPDTNGFGCYVTPPYVHRSCFILDPPPRWGNAAVNFDIYAGDAFNSDGSGLRNLRIRGWANPYGVGVDPEQIICEEACIDVEISCLPANSYFTLDSLARKAKLSKGGVISRGSQFLSSRSGNRFIWPAFDCTGLYVCVDADGTGTSPEATITISTQEYERG